MLLAVHAIVIKVGCYQDTILQAKHRKNSLEKPKKLSSPNSTGDSIAYNYLVWRVVRIFDLQPVHIPFVGQRQELTRIRIPNIISVSNALHMLLLVCDACTDLFTLWAAIVACACDLSMPPSFCKGMSSEHVVNVSRSFPSPQDASKTDWGLIERKLSNKNPCRDCRAIDSISSW